MSTPRRAWLPWLLLAVTCLSTTWAGVALSEARGARLWLQQLAGPLAGWIGPWTADARVWGEAFSFSATLMAILIAHEWGHWFAARRLGMPTSLPYFLPGPPPFGTFGAVIGLEERPAPANHLLIMAAAGPFAGMVVVVAALLVGLSWSDVRPSPVSDASTLGESLLLQGLRWLQVGAMPPSHDVWLHPMAFAGWAGCLVTALNLLPFAQLDGGHIAYAMWGQRWNAVVGRVFVGVGLLAVVLYLPWLVPLLLLRFALGLAHPPTTLGDVASGRVRWVGWAAALLLVLTITPRPFHDPALSPWARFEAWRGEATDPRSDERRDTRSDAAGL